MVTNFYNIHLNNNSRECSVNGLFATGHLELDSEPGTSSDMGRYSNEGLKAAIEPESNTSTPNRSVQTAAMQNNAHEGSVERLLEDKIKLTKKVSKKQGIKIASLNMNGRRYTNKKSKLKDISKLMRQERIAILAVQETHLTEDLLEKAVSENPSLQIISNSNNPAAAGVGFIINCNELNTEVAEVKHVVLIENRASRLCIEWGTNNALDIIVVYAPNEVGPKIEFLQSLYEQMNKCDRLTTPIVMGDWNFVEEGIDRSPIHDDDNRLRDAFRQIKQKYKLVDGWRIHHPANTSFTYAQKSSGSLARIDRAYANKEAFLYTMKWDIASAGHITDHRMITIEIIKTGVPFMGKGLSKFSLELLKYQPFIKECTNMLYEAQQDILDPNKEEGIQLRWAKVQQDILTMANQKSKERLRELDKKFKKASIQLNQTLKAVNTQLLERSEIHRATIHELTEKVNSIRQDRLDAMHLKSKARYDMESEKMTRYWFRSQKTLPGIKHYRAPKATPGPDTVLGLMNRDDKLTTNTKDMVKIASNYHAKLQSEQKWTDDREAALQQLLSTVKIKLDPQERLEIGTDFDEVEVRQALYEGDNGKCPGISGLQYEFWKYWEKKPKSLSQTEAKTPHGKQMKELKVVQMMTRVFNDIKKEGVKEACFTEGVMCLIYKKKDKRKIENYRPITLLNTDYKIMTKAIAKRLADVTDTLIHGDQAGFCPGRSITDSARLTRTMIDYCENRGINGCIVALDQEKAYDKIAHDYLWRILEHMNFPETFINMIKELYKSAKTRVMVNGVLPTPIEIMRGVRQGDPMSCLLYNLAIEPLACYLRSSQLKGFKINGIKDRILASLFADDTLVYVNERDDLNTLENAIKVFCTASTAKFNNDKNEYLPIGTPEFRKRFYESRKLNDKPGNTISPELRIVKDGEAMRTLGAWVGNNVSTNPQWESILDRQVRTIQLWTKARLSTKGKELIIKSLVQSLAVYLATVNGMPADIETRMNRLFKNFLWDDKKVGYMRYDEVRAPIEMGGLNMPDIKLRNEAIQIIWLQKYLRSGTERPKWAYVADQIISDNIPPKPIIEESARLDWILQSWNEYANKIGDIPHYLIQMLKVGRKYNVRLDAPKLDLTSKNEMIIWYHPSIHNNYYWNKMGGKCLRNTHGIRTVRDLHGFIIRPDAYPRCKRKAQCKKTAITILSLLPPKYSPLHGTPIRDGLDFTLRRKEKYKNAHIKEEPIRFNPDVTLRAHPRTGVRIFGNETSYKIRNKKDTVTRKKVAYRTGHQHNQKNITLYTDGSAKGGKAGIGVWHKENSARNVSARAPPGSQTNQRAELLAFIAAVQQAGNDNLTIMTDSLSNARAAIKSLQEWEDKDFIGIAHEQEWRLLAALLRKRPATTDFQWVKAHCGIIGNEKADQLAEQGRVSGQELKVDYNQDKEWIVTGASLGKLTQRTAYSLLIREHFRKPGSCSETTSNNIEDALEEIARISIDQATEPRLWMAIRKAPITKKKTDFLWKLNHSRVRTGTYFSVIPELSERQYCLCGEVEDYTHMLTQCYEAKLLWLEVSKIWGQASALTWHQPSIGIIRGLGAVRLGTDEIESPSDSYLYKSLVIAGVWEIWKYRNAKVHREVSSSSDRLIAAWKQAVTSQITIEYQQILMMPLEKRTALLDRFKKTWIRKSIARFDKIDNVLKLTVLL